MNAKSTEEQQLKREIRWAKECLLIADNAGTSHEIIEAQKQHIPIQFKHFSENMAIDELKEHIERLESDLEDLQEGEF